MLTAKQRRRIRRYDSMGLGPTEISKLVDCSRTSIYYQLDKDYRSNVQTYYRDKYRAAHGL